MSFCPSNISWDILKLDCVGSDSNSVDIVILTAMLLLHLRFKVSTQPFSYHSNKTAGHAFPRCHWPETIYISMDMPRLEWCVTMESVCLELDEGLRQRLCRVYMLRGESSSAKVQQPVAIKGSTTHSVKYYPRTISEVCSFDFLASPAHDSLAWCDPTAKQF